MSRQSGKTEDSVDDDREPKKRPRLILEQQIQEGRSVVERPVTGLFLSGLSAGLELGFSLFLIAVARTLADGSRAPLAEALLNANMYAVGFLFVILGRSELFTEQTTLAVLPVLDGSASLGSLARTWAVVYLANLIGGAAFAGLAVVVGPGLGVIDPHVFGEIAGKMTAYSWHMIFLSAVLAGWLMGLLSWLVAAARDTISQVALVWIITAVIGLTHLHHVVVGAIEVMAGLFSGGDVTASDLGRLLVWASLGNAVGGVVCVALIKYGHARQSEPDQDGGKEQ